MFVLFLRKNIAIIFQIILFFRQSAELLAMERISKERRGICNLPTLMKK
jgi:hypothetical protein